MLRHVEPELLDSLPPTDPGAIHSRRDLRLLNFCLGHSRIFARQLQRAFPEKPPKHLIDLGGGDGAFLLKVGRQMGHRWEGLDVLIIDRHDVIAAETRLGFAAIGWRLHLAEHDAMDFLQRRAASFSDVMIANLVLHHFSDLELRSLFRAAKESTSLLLAAEPRRSVLALLFSRAVGLIGCNAVTRHDAPASVISGFAGNDLSRLWGESDRWSLEERPAGLFSHLFQARRILH